MALPSYQVVLIDPATGETVHIFDQTASIEMHYERVFSDVGAFAMTLPGSDAIYNLFPLDTLIEVLRTHPATGELTVEETYFARYRQRYIEDDVERVVVGGVSLTHLLQRRVVDPADDPLQAGGYSTKAGAADTIIAQYISEQASSAASAVRAFPHLTVPAVTGVGRSSGARLRFENLLEAMQSLAKQGGVDITISRTTGNNMEVYVGPVGTDRTKSHNYPSSPWVGLTPLRGNLTRPNLEEDRRDEKNFCYALGQGKGDTRKVLRVQGAGVADSPFNRIEYVEDIRNAEKVDALALLTGAQASLAQQPKPLKFSFEPTGVEGGNVYRENWDLGDRITVLWGDIERDIRIMGVELTINEQGESIQVHVEDTLGAA